MNDRINQYKAQLDLINEDRKAKGKKNRTHAVWVLSKIVPGYSNLSTAKVRGLGGTVVQCGTLSVLMDLDVGCSHADLC